MNTLMSVVQDGMNAINDLYDPYFDQNPEWSEKESNLYHRVDELVDALTKATAEYADYLRQHTRP